MLSPNTLQPMTGPVCLAIATTASGPPPSSRRACSEGDGQQSPHSEVWPLQVPTAFIAVGPSVVCGYNPHTHRTGMCTMPQQSSRYSGGANLAQHTFSRKRIGSIPGGPRLTLKKNAANMHVKPGLKRSTFKCLKRGDPPNFKTSASLILICR